MKRRLMGLAACLIVVAQVARAQSPTELAQTANYIAAFQNPDGGFAAKVGGPSTLGGTSSAIRSLKYTGGSIPDVLAAIKYVKSCYNPEIGGFAPTPGGKPDIATTAVGLMAVSELKIADDKMIEATAKFFSENARTFEEVRIAVAGLEAVKKTLPDDFKKWSTDITKTQNPDGTFGEGAGKARETGGKAVALLRMGEKVDKQDAVVAFLKEAQRPDGAWSKGEDGSELESTYRIMRFFFMANQSPDLERLKSFIAQCRHSDGGYGVKPGAEATPGATYYATIIARWARLLNHEPALVETAGFQPLFDGKTLDGWDGDKTLWSARDGMLVGTSKGLKQNNFLAFEKDFDDFVLKLSFQLVNGEGNSGVQFRSVRVPGHEMSGYQADLGQNYWGCLYDESRRNKILVEASDAAKKALRPKEFNQYGISADGDNIKLTLNGANSVTYHEDDPAIARSGKIAVQIHAGGPMEIRFKDLYIQPIPVPREDSETTPGFHLRTLKSGGDERKYTVYIPQGYDGKKTFPVVLFLHGSGESGKYGIRAAQVGIGPAIYNNPENFPAIAVIPQARQTWSAASDDAKAALAALDEVLESLKVDSKRVALTGLSMGGHGAWEIAAAHPERFSAVAPICGGASVELAKSLAAAPVWAVVGDNDREQTVLGMRRMVEAINEAGGKAKLTEYRDVGHNSWDRAYNNPILIDWLVSQIRK